MTPHANLKNLWDVLPVEARPPVLIGPTDGPLVDCRIISNAYQKEHDTARSERRLISDKTSEALLCHAAVEWLETQVDNYEIRWSADGYSIDSWSSVFDDLIDHYKTRSQLLAAAVKAVKTWTPNPGTEAE